MKTFRFINFNVHIDKLSNLSNINDLFLDQVSYIIGDRDYEIISFTSNVLNNDEILIIVLIQELLNKQ